MIYAQFHQSSDKKELETNTHIKYRKRTQHSQVSPPMHIKDIERPCQELIRITDGTELAVLRGGRVEELPTSVGHVARHVFPACESRRGRYVNEFDG